MPRSPERGRFPRRLPLLTPVPAGTNAVTPPPAVLPPPVIVAGRKTAERRAVVVRTPLPVIPVLVRPPRVIRSDYGRGGVIFRVLPPPANPVVLAIRPPRVVRSEFERGAVVHLLPLPPYKAAVSVSGGILPPLIKRSGYSRNALIFLSRPPPFLKINVAGGVLPPRVIRSDFLRGGIVYYERPPLAPAIPNIPGFAVLTRPRVVLGPREERRGLVYLSQYPPTPTGLAGPHLQISCGPDNHLPVLLLAELGFTPDLKQLYCSDGTTDYHMGGAWVTAPSSSTAYGRPGWKAYDGTYIYFCVAANTWVRFAATSF